MTAENTVVKALYAVVENRVIHKKLIFHSDRGSQYTRTTFRNILKTTRNLWNKVCIEKENAEISIFKWIETWYNRNRIHSALNYKTINEHELEINNKNLAA